MRHIYSILVDELEKNHPLAVATIVETKGSTPQVQGASAIFSMDGLVAGTLGGGIIEAEAEKKAKEAIRDKISVLYETDLDADTSDHEAAICGGKAFIMIDAAPEIHLNIFRGIDNSIRERQSGALISVIPKGNTELIRHWVQKSILGNSDLGIGILQHETGIIQNSEEINKRLEKNKYYYNPENQLFIESISPYPQLLIAGAGHIGKAVCHLASLLGFEITVIDDRPEYCNKVNLPEADQLIAGDMGKAVYEFPKSVDTYIAIVTRGHKNDEDVLRQCLDADVAYIGMIGSKRKIRLMRDKFLKEGLATSERLDRLHAPIGIEIGSKTIHEIAVSICAQLIYERNQKTGGKNKTIISAIILAAGESSRMGQSKMLLPYGNKTIIEAVIKTAIESRLKNIVVVIGSAKDKIREQIRDYPVIVAENPDYLNGMLSSIQCGLRALPDDTDAVMILLGDQPMIDGLVIDQLADHYEHSDKGILIASHNGKRGHPILFKIKYKKEIEQLSIQDSMHDFTRKFAADILEVEAGTADILKDIDTLEDYNKELKYRRLS